ncbi:FBD-associated F-box protein At4g10400 [Cajanus cajan]|uniref:F-box protein At4g10400 n=1 Tax=Cajanus cajan TaxID=3821 RepID=A0A151UCN0_CAJCA|nr:FBD-associated F-box protein At4g10400 [Cajanus cajan]KYP77047.1 F-box protein At4g10400 [Cajanus cajan]
MTIEALPDDHLCLILSFLSTKEAIATSLLYKRWRFLWTMGASLHIGCAKPIMEHYKSLKVFLALRRMHNITSFRLNCDSDHDCCSHYVEQWILEVAIRKVERVNISLCRSHISEINVDAFFTCTTIVNMKIKSPYEITIPSSVYLPNLKILLLKVHERFPKSNASKIISGSPSIELIYMEINWTTDYVEQLTVVHNYRYFRLDQQTWLYDFVMHYDYDFMSDSMQNCGLLKPDKTKVYVTVHKDMMQQAVSNLLKGIYPVKFLSLKYSRDVNPSNFDLPLFNNLVELQLFVKKDDPFIMEFPAKCPKLQVLEINILDDGQRCRYNITEGVRVHDLSIVPISPVIYMAK